jgi:N-dimethylarginine dimethylaminohydrolase
VEFSSFIRGEGYDIIPIKHEHQLAYACNVLNLGKGRIISVHAPSAREIVKHEAFKGDVQVRHIGLACFYWVLKQQVSV